MKEDKFKNFQCIKDEQGLTLVELIIVIALLGVITMVAFRFVDFGVNAFRIGNEQVDEQVELRLAALNITQEVRNVFKVELTGISENATLPDVDKYSIYASSEGIILVNQLGETIRVLSNDIVQSVNFSCVQEKNRIVLIFRLNGPSKELTTRLLLNNVINIDGTGIGTLDILSADISSDDNNLVWENRVRYSDDLDH